MVIQNCCWRKSYHRGNNSQLWKIRGQEKLVDALSKIINMMRDLHQLAEQHNIKSRLYSGHGLERVYQVMGDSWVTRWLSTICEVEYNDEQTWHHLIEFLECDLKVQQQKLLIENKSENKRQKQVYEEKGHVGRYNSHFTGNSNMEPVLFLWRSWGAHCNKWTKREKKCAVLCLSEICRNGSQRPISRTEKQGLLISVFTSASMMECVIEILCVSTNHMTSIL